MLHIYTGNGKGKTTASVGLAVRAAGAGLRVYFYQMMKDGSSSEIAMLEKLGVTVKAAQSCCKFSRQMNSSERALAEAEHAQMLAEIAMTVGCGRADLVVIDEFFCALSEGFIDKTLAETMLLGNLGDTELVLTGRGACSPYTDAADYISEIAPIKHPYEKGVMARKGIEY